VAILFVAMSSVSSVLTSLASVSTMDFVKHFFPQRSETFFLRFSKISTVLWAVALILVAYLSRQVAFVLNAAFSLRGLTSGALLDGLGLAIFSKKGRAASVIAGMTASLAVMTAIQTFPKWHVTSEIWARTIGTEIFWPWYTLIGLLVTSTVASLIDWLLAKRADRVTNQR
jgi:Na+/proline symporter